MNQATGKAQEVYLVDSVGRLYQQTKGTVLGQVCPGALLSVPLHFAHATVQVQLYPFLGLISGLAHWLPVGHLAA